MKSNQGQSKNVAQEDSAIGPVVGDRVHFEGGQEECGIGHGVGKIEYTLPVLECILNSAAMLDEMFGVELVVTLLLQDRSKDV